MKRWARLCVLALAACGQASSVPPGHRCTGDAAADIGGSFTLVDHRGQTVTESVLADRYALVYFGFTFCPDVCPDSMARLSAALRIAGEDGADLSGIQPVFITIDPERDDPAAVADFLQRFDPRFIGLTGTLEQMAGAVEAYHVYRAKTDLGDGYYSFSHSDLAYLMDPAGHYVTHFTPEDTAGYIADWLSPCL